MLHWLLDKAWDRYLKHDDDIVVGLGAPQEGSTHAVVYKKQLWNNLTAIEKLKFLFAGKWFPTEEQLRTTARNVLADEIFGDDENLGDMLFLIAQQHENKTWDWSNLTEYDKERAWALHAHATVVFRKFKNLTTFPPLDLKLSLIHPKIWMLIFPMSSKIPVYSLRNFIYVHPLRAFAELRNSPLENKESLISSLYEILFLQQKTALALYELFQNMDEIYRHKNGQTSAVLLTAEARLLMCADLLITYLKATVEKTTAFLADIHGTTPTEKKKTHKERLAILDRELPPIVKELFYGEILLDFIKSENLSELNKFRTGLLHKKGISKMQPHSYTKHNNFKDTPAFEIFSFVYEHHHKNTITIFSCLALLTDQLMRFETEENKLQYRKENTELEFNDLVISKIAKGLADFYNIDDQNSVKTEE